MKFIVEENLASEAAWWLVDDDDVMVAWAGRTFPSLGAADEAAHDFRVNPGDPHYRVYEDAAGSWRWAAWCPLANRVAISWSSFISEATATHAARGVQTGASSAIGP